MPEILLDPAIWLATAVWAGSKRGEAELATPTVPRLVLALVTYTVRA